MTNPNELVQINRVGLDELTEQRNRIVAMAITSPDCSYFRDAVVLAFDILTQVLIEHFPLMAESQGRPVPPDREQP